MKNIGFLEILIEVFQLPVIAVIIFLCLKAGRVLHSKKFYFVLFAFVANLIYILLNIFNAPFFIEYGFNISGEIDLTMSIELFDLLTFGFFTIAFYQFFTSPHNLAVEKKFRGITEMVQKNKQLTLFILITAFALVVYLLFFKGYMAVNYQFVSSFYKAFSITLLFLFFLKIKFKSNATQISLVFGLGIWMLLQFPYAILISFHMETSQYGYIFFIISLFAKIFIAVSLYSAPYAHEKTELSEAKEEEFKKILETIFHELSLPMNAMDLNLTMLAKADASKNQKYIELESDFEKIHAIVLNAQDAFKNVPNNDILGNQDPGPYPTENMDVLNLNRIVQKCIMAVKGQFNSFNINFNIKYGKQVHTLGNESEVYQVISNLIKNAVESYDVKSLKKDINITTGHKLHENVTVPFVEIGDFGVGIPGNNLESIWRRGFSTKSKANKLVTGQGLAVVRRLTEKNDITIDLNSLTEDLGTRKKGTIFCLYFKEP